MKGNRYILTAMKSDLAIEFQYDLNGRLIEWKIDPEVSDIQHKWLINHVPGKEEHLKLYSKEDKFVVELIPKDLSFDAFWNAYEYKTGSKPKSAKLWSKLTNAERVRVFNHIPKYNRHLKMKNTAKAYPTTYLNGEYYNN